MLATLLLFFAAYLTTLWAFLTVLQSLDLSRSPRLVELGKGLGVSQNKWLALVALMAFTGFPPFLLFFAKLNLLAAIFSTGGWQLLGVALGLIFTGWALYATSALKVILQLWPTTVAGKPASLPAPLILCLLLFLCFGALWYGDLWLGALWLIALKW